MKKTKQIIVILVLTLLIVRGVFTVAKAKIDPPLPPANIVEQPLK